jgi:1,4-dihydroxy-2-naphthoate octaprenyltransferase
MNDALSPPSVWLHAIRPKTLFASVAPILVGSAVAQHEGGFHFGAAIVALAVAHLLQIIANLANDYFDFRRGADEHRVGPLRVMQAGLVSARQMQIAIGLTVVLAIAGGLYLVARGGWPIFLLGLAAVVCAVAYTGGPWPLGYHGLGDLFVFIFFGLVGVAGSAYVQTRDLTWFAIIASLPIACLATAIIIANNLRDIESDRAAGKHTLATRLGRMGTIREYQLLIAIAYLIPLLLAIFSDVPWAWLVIPVALPIALPLVASVRTATGKGLIPVLVGTSRLTFVFGAIFAFGIVL